MPTDARLAGVYLLTPDARGEAFARVLRAVEQALAAGVTAVQYRNKAVEGAERERQARELIDLVQAARALAIINDDPWLAQRLGADGVHLGRDDTDVASARSVVGERLIGVSCYDDTRRAAAAVAAGADAVAFGSVFGSPTKPDAVRAPLDLLGQARRRHRGLTVIAIGGINADNIAQVARAGAHAAAVISALFDAADAGAAARLLRQRFEQGRQLHESQRAAV